jgi:membrane associated rhomboid family serine protease
MPAFRQRYQTTRYQSRHPSSLSLGARFDRLPNSTVLWSVVGINTIVFLTWKYAQHDAAMFRNPELLTKMYKNFVVSGYNVAQGRLWTVVTSAFSHYDTMHFGINMFVLVSLGDAVSIL